VRLRVITCKATVNRTSNDGIEPDELWAQTTAIPVTPPPSGTPSRQLVVIDRTSATRVAEIPLPKGLYTSISSLDVLGDQILINIYDSNSGAMGKPILMSFTGTSMTLDTAGTATFDEPFNQ
jgi:hypothetical protein